MILSFTVLTVGLGAARWGVELAEEAGGKAVDAGGFWFAQASRNSSSSTAAGLKIVYDGVLLTWLLQRATDRMSRCDMLPIA
jgi:hypothetical protein